MPQPRCRLVSLEATPHYHVVSRCVRRQFLCGKDRLTGRDFSHRRDWIRARIFELAEIFAVDICAYAVMSNHVHLVLTLRQDVALAWDDREVAERWLRLFSGRPVVKNWLAGRRQSEAQVAAALELVRTYRERLFDLSWFMRCLNEPIARMANAEDNVTGRFWEGRFKSQALLDEAALVSLMAYVDLNPIRAGMAETPEESDYTSLQQRVIESRLENAPEQKEALPEDLQAAIGKLARFAPKSGLREDGVLPVTFASYVELVDYTGRAIAHGKKGVIDDRLPPILQRLKARPEGVLEFLTKPQSLRSPSVLGPVQALRELAQEFGRKFLNGHALATQLFG
ncbi:transposase [Halomonas denitrificans]|nr:transposase [Halomonas denitrificans]